MLPRGGGSQQPCGTGAGLQTSAHRACMAGVSKTSPALGTAVERCPRVAHLPSFLREGGWECTQASWTCFFSGFLGSSFAGFEDVQRKMCLILVIAGFDEVCWAQRLLVWRMQSTAGLRAMAFDYTPMSWRRRPSLSPVCQSSRISGGLRCG